MFGGEKENNVKEGNCSFLEFIFVVIIFLNILLWWDNKIVNFESRELENEGFYVKEKEEIYKVIENLVLFYVFLVRYYNIF